MEKVFIGIDISKKTLDFFVKSTFYEKHFQIKNNLKEISKLIKKCLKSRML